MDNNSIFILHMLLWTIIGHSVTVHIFRILLEHSKKDVPIVTILWVSQLQLNDLMSTHTEFYFSYTEFIYLLSHRVIALLFSLYAIRRVHVCSVNYGRCYSVMDIDKE